MRRWLRQSAWGFWLVGASWACAGEPASGIDRPIELKDGDRVVLLGSTLIERDGESGYLETRIARRNPGRSIVVRNLGWSGDTVDGVSWSVGNPPANGFRQLVEHVLALKPTVIVLGYGSNESFASAAGLPAFAAGLDRLWTALAPAGARMVVLTPPRQENLGPPLPDPTGHNLDLARYGDFLRAEAARRGATGVDLFPSLVDPGLGDPLRPLTTNGLHFTPEGYRVVAARIAPALVGPEPRRWEVTIRGDQAEASGSTISDLARRPTGVQFRTLDTLLPEPTAMPGRLLRVTGLVPGSYQLRVDGAAVRTADAAEWQAGLMVGDGPEFDQMDALRGRIKAKNLFYFHRWRPQNQTYLFGFRKHEQGQNAAEIAAFDPLIAAEEAEIARLSRPVPHTYELTRIPDGEVPR